MGRGRAKAKQTKVARELKYSSGDMDVSRLQEELAAERGNSSYTSSSEEDDEENEYGEADEYAED